MKRKIVGWLILGCSVLIGLALLISGFLYDLIFAGIPYQDATPEMQANYEKHSGIASSIMISGALMLALSIIAVVIHSLNKRIQK